MWAAVLPGAAAYSPGIPAGVVVALFKPRTTTVPVYQGDDLERLAELRMQVAQAQRDYDEAREAAESNVTPLRGGDPVPSCDDERAALEAAKAAYNAAVDDAEPRAVIVRLTAIGNARWAALLAAHPPRDDNDADEAYAANTDTFPAALLKFRDGDRATATVDDSLLDAEDIDDLAAGDFERLWNTAYWLNRSPGGDPKQTAFEDDSLTSDAN